MLLSLIHYYAPNTETEQVDFFKSVFKELTGQKLFRNYQELVEKALTSLCHYVM